jgi:hypothetical protein
MGNGKYSDMVRSFAVQLGNCGDDAGTDAG